MGPTLNAGSSVLRFFKGSGPVLEKNPIALWFFRRCSVPQLWICASLSTLETGLMVLFASIYI